MRASSPGPVTTTPSSSASRARRSRDAKRAGGKRGLPHAEPGLRATERYAEWPDGGHIDEIGDARCVSELKELQGRRRWERRGRRVKTKPNIGSDGRAGAGENAAAINIPIPRGQGDLT